MPMAGFPQARPNFSLPPRKAPKSFRGRSSTAHPYSSLRGPHRGRAKGLKSILPRLPIATQSSRLNSPAESSVQKIKKEKDSPRESKSRSILLTAGDTYSPDTGELLPNPSNLIPFEPQFDTPPVDQSREADESEENNKSQIGDMLPGIEGAHSEGSSTSRPGT